TGDIKPGRVKTGVRSEKSGSNPSDTVQGVDGVPLQVENIDKDIRVVASARLLVKRMGGLPTRKTPSSGASGSLAPSAALEPLTLLDGPAAKCPAFRLQVLWEPPVGQYQVGAYVSPLGPAPTE